LEFPEEGNKPAKDLPNERHGKFLDNITIFFMHATHKVIVNITKIKN